MVKDFRDTTILIPTLNEVNTIGGILAFILETYPNIKIIICDDGSQDGTPRVVQNFKGVHFLDRSNKKVHGLTASILDGLSLTNTHYFVVIDGDGQHPPDKILGIISLLRQGNNLVIGYRSEVPDWGIHRRTLSYIARILGELTLIIRGAPRCKDLLSGFFGGDTHYLRMVVKNTDSFELGGYKILFDILKKSPRTIKIANLGYVFQTRAGGKSKMNARIIWTYIKSIFK